jgi:hypothetical protein
VVATCELMDFASFSTYLQLMGGGTESREPGRYDLSNLRIMALEDPRAEAASPGATLPETPASAISVPVAHCSASSVPSTSVANATTSCQ